MYNRTHAMAALFMSRNQDIKVVVEGVPLVDDALAALFDNSADVVMASRTLTEPEDQSLAAKGILLEERLIGYGGIVIITHPKNSLNELTVAQIQQLLKGKVTKWKEIGGADEPVVVVKTGETFPGTRAFIEEELLGKSPIASTALVAPNFYEAMRKVAETPGSLGYVRVRDAFESSVSADVSVKVMKVKKGQATLGIMPSRASIADGTYPLRRPYFLYSSANPNGALKAYIDFVLEKGWGAEQ